MNTETPLPRRFVAKCTHDQDKRALQDRPTGFPGGWCCPILDMKTEVTETKTPWEQDTLLKTAGVRAKAY